jgi:hypothetical protein
MWTIYAFRPQVKCFHATYIHVVHTDQPDIVAGARADGTQNRYTLVLGYMRDIQHYVSLEPMMRYVLE